MEVVESASTLGSLVFESGRTISFFMGSIGDELDPGVGGGPFEGSGDGEPTDKAMEVVGAASTLRFLALESDSTISFFIGSICDVLDLGVGDGLFECFGVAGDKNLRRRRMVDDNDSLVVTVLIITALRYRYPLWYT